ncbi:MAG: ABC transporter ATP-binding protein [Bacteroidota bacterium]
MEAEASTPAIRLSHLSCTRGSRQVLSDLSGTLRSGLTFLAGNNGSGKSSLLSCLLKTLKFSGKIEVAGKALDTYSRQTLAQEITFVPQHLEVPPYVKVKDFVLTGRFPYLNAWGNYSAADRELVSEAMERMNVSAFGDRMMSQLSGGERQRVLLARSLAQGTSIWLLDEPAHSLDPKAKSELYQLLWELAAAGNSLLCVSHDLEAVLDKRAHVWGLLKGELRLNHPARELDRTRLMEELYV